MQRFATLSGPFALQIGSLFPKKFKQSVDSTEHHMLEILMLMIMGKKQVEQTLVKNYDQTHKDKLEEINNAT